MSLHAAGRANQCPMVPAFPNLTSTIAILRIVIPDTHRVFDHRPSGSERAFALLASEKRATADKLWLRCSRPLLTQSGRPGETIAARTLACFDRQWSGLKVAGYLDCDGLSVRIYGAII
jgi:hypothetical protein